jgi:replicative superfamily II helicase
VKVSEYQWYRPDFCEYNESQSAVVPFCDQDLNLVVCFGTAAGKTAIAECCFGFHVANGGKVAYLAPYRSLCQEKYEKWENDPHFIGAGVGIRTGEHRTDEDDFEKSGLVVMTTEAFDSRTRSQAAAEWTKSLSCVVFDEAHVIGEHPRGMAIEAAMMRLTAVNPGCRLVLLSATMDNAIEVAKWVKSLNAKPTKCFISGWRPGSISLDVHEASDKLAKVVDLVSGTTSKTIVFVHSKQVGKDLMQRLRRKGVMTAFHNASVPKGKRARIEKAFDEVDGFKVLISTSTLGAGVNL